MRGLRMGILASATAPAGGAGDIFDSDDFSGGIGAWTQVDPVGSGVTFSGVGSSPNIYAQIAIASGASHNFNGGNHARLVKATNNVDFTLTLKLVAVPTASFQQIGLVVNDASGNYVTVGYYYDGGARLYRQDTGGANFSGGSVQSSLWLRITRAGNSWTTFGSDDGSTWNEIGSAFTYALTITQAGPYVGTEDDTIAYTGQFDWIEDSSDPITGEDA